MKARVTLISQAMAANKLTVEDIVVKICGNAEDAKVKNMVECVLNTHDNSPSHWEQVAKAVGLNDVDTAKMKAFAEAYRADDGRKAAAEKAAKLAAEATAKSWAETDDGIEYDAFKACYDRLEDIYAESLKKAEKKKSEKAATEKKVDTATTESASEAPVEDPFN